MQKVSFSLLFVRNFWTQQKQWAFLFVPTEKFPNFRKTDKTKMLLMRENKVEFLFLCFLESWFWVWSLKGWKMLLPQERVGAWKFLFLKNNVQNFQKRPSLKIQNFQKKTLGQVLFFLIFISFCFSMLPKMQFPFYPIFYGRKWSHVLKTILSGYFTPTLHRSEQLFEKKKTTTMTKLILTILGKISPQISLFERFAFYPIFYVRKCPETNKKNFLKYFKFYFG